MSQPPLPPPPGELSGPATELPPFPSAPPLVAGPPPYASFWRRLWALVIDAFVLIPLSIPIWFAFIDEALPEIRRVARTGGEMNLDAFTDRVARWTLLLAAVQYAYFALMVRYRGATLGKMALGIWVRRASDGGPVGWREALIRPIFQVVVGLLGRIPGVSLIGLLDYLWMIWDRQSQTLHDKLAGTVVVMKG